MNKFINKEGLPKVAIVLVNYNGWRDTIECLESLLKLNYNNFDIIIIDNNSTDDSISKLLLWADGQLEAIPIKNNYIQSLVYPLVPKPVDVRVIGANQIFETSANNSLVTIVQSDLNLGFAGGNNLGIKLAIFRGIPYIWLLNNDTVVDKNSLTELVNTAAKEPGGQAVGIIGSKLFFYDRPTCLQAVAGKYNPVFATSKHIGCNEIDGGQYDAVKLTRNHYIVGASMFVTSTFIRKVGLMNEEYFLYYEEIDWRNRALKNNFEIQICSKSIVYHKEGASISPGNKKNKEKSRLSDLYSIKNRFIITKKYYPQYLFFVYLTLIPIIINRLKRKQFDRVVLAYQLFKDSFGIKINEDKVN